MPEPPCPAAMPWMSASSSPFAPAPLRLSRSPRAPKRRQGSTATHKNSPYELAEQVKQGFITDPSEVGGWPEYKGTPYQDSDHDGLPNAWEKKHGLNSSDPTDAMKDSNNDGYTNIEEFINGRDPRGKRIDWTDLKNNPKP